MYEYRLQEVYKSPVAFKQPKELFIAHIRYLISPGKQRHPIISDDVPQRAFIVHLLDYLVNQLLENIRMLLQ